MRFIGVDPATVTGFVALDENGEVVEERTIKGVGKTVKGGITPKQLVSLENQFYDLLEPGDQILIEDAAPGTQKSISTGMIHGGLRTMIERKDLNFDIVSPGSVKKFVGVTGFKEVDGKRVRLEGEKEKKEAMAAGALSHFDYSHPDHNVVDAYIIARICRAMYLFSEYKPTIDNYPYQIEVIQTILGKAEDQ
jgi:crossover junction endodeoxyribonuclease RuvC